MEGIAHYVTSLRGAWTRDRLGGGGLFGRLMVDASVLIAHLRGKAHGPELMRWAGAAGVPYVSAVSILEVTQGMAEREEEATRTLLDSLETVDITFSILTYNVGHFDRVPSLEVLDAGSISRLA